MTDPARLFAKLADVLDDREFDVDGPAVQSSAYKTRSKTGLLVCSWCSGAGDDVVPFDIEPADWTDANVILALVEAYLRSKPDSKPRFEIRLWPGSSESSAISDDAATCDEFCEGPHAWHESVIRALAAAEGVK